VSARRRFVLLDFLVYEIRWLVRDMVTVGASRGTYLAGTPLHGSSSTPLLPPVPLLHLLSTPIASHPVCMGRRGGVGCSWMGVSCVVSATVVSNSLDPKKTLDK
jgi:hypothetical protein